MCNPSTIKKKYNAERNNWINLSYNGIIVASVPKLMKRNPSEIEHTGRNQFDATSVVVVEDDINGTIKCVQYVMNGPFSSAFL